MISSHGGFQESKEMADLRPVGSFGTEHWPDTPTRTKHVQGLGEAVVVNDASVDREDPHQEDDVAPSKDHVEHLQRKTSGWVS